MKTENDGFTPVIPQSLEALVRTLQANEAERQRLEQKLYLCRRKGRILKNKKKEAKELQNRLEELKQEQEGIIPETTQQLEELKQGRRPFTIPDEVEQPFNECVGYAYGVAVCVDDSGSLLYCEAQEDAVQIGETLPANELHPFADLPNAEQDMILRHLAGREETPEWFKERIGAA